jgi:hypothetical protein
LVHRTILLIFLALLVANLPAAAGGSIFSANGNGEQVVGGGTRAQGLGGGAFGFADSMSFNTENPALAAFARRTIIRISGEATAWTTYSGGHRDSDTDFEWKDFCLYFPVTSRWTIGAGAQPLRLMDLKTFDSLNASFDGREVVGYQQRNTFRGSSVGLRLDNAYRFNDQLSAGLSIEYTIERHERDRVLSLPAPSPYQTDTSYYYSTSYSDIETFRAWAPTFGVYYSIIPALGVGVAYRPRMKGQWEYIFSKNGNDSTFSRSRRGDQPGDFRAGLSYRLSKRVFTVADVETGQFAAGDLGIVAALAHLDKPVNPLFVSLGVERLAAKAPAYTGFETLGLRGGLYYRKNYWPERNGATVNDYGLTGGVSLPVAGGDGWLHFTGELGLRGQDEQKLGAKEFFARGSLQLEISETWFQRTKPRQPK